MKYVEALEPYDGVPKVFLAGGITNCPDWQAEVIEMLSDLDIVIFNPRRANFPIDDPGASYAQIRWEHRHLNAATHILFWFPKETLCPITLYELGAWSMTHKPMVVGCHPEYKRFQDVEIQTFLARPEIDVVTSLEDLVDQLMPLL